MARTGFFGGTFNPIHRGHIHLAEEARKALKLDRLILVPANIPPHKEAHNLCTSAERFEMCRLAAENHEGFEVSDFELKQGGKSYSVYTAEHFSEIYPDDELFMMVGSDMFLCFDKWYRFEDILKKVTLAVVSREYDDMESLKKKSDELSAFGKTVIVNAEPFPLSSTEIRKMIAGGQNYSCYLPEKVVQYIRLNKLYGNAESD